MARRSTKTIVVNKGGRRRSGRRYSKGKKGGIGLSLSTEYLAGIAASFFVKSPALNTIIPVVAVAPVKGIGQVKAVAQGYMLGNILQAFTGFGLNLGNSSSGNGGNTV